MMSSRSRQPLIALDIGGARTGVAYFDGIVRIATPLTVLPTENLGDWLSSQLPKLRIDTVIVGYPRNMNGDETAQTKQVVQVINDLRLANHIKVKYQDESLTSVAADERMATSGMDKSMQDAVAASIILEDYIREQYGL